MPISNNLRDRLSKRRRRDKSSFLFPSLYSLFTYSFVQICSYFISSPFTYLKFRILTVLTLIIALIVDSIVICNFYVIQFLIQNEMLYKQIGSLFLVFNGSWHIQSPENNLKLLIKTFQCSNLTEFNS